MFFFCSVLKQILFINNWFVWLRYYISTSCCMCTCFFFFLIITVLLERVENLLCCKLFIVFYLLECLRFTMYRHVPLRMERTSSCFQATDLLVCTFGSAACAFSFLRYVLFYLLWIVTVTKFVLRRLLVWKLYVMLTLASTLAAAPHVCCCFNNVRMVPSGTLSNAPFVLHCNGTL